MLGRMTKDEFDRLDEDDRWMTVAGFQNSEDVDLPLSDQEQAIADRDAVIELQNQKLQECASVMTNAAQVVGRYMEARSQTP